MIVITRISDPSHFSTDSDTSKMRIISLDTDNFLKISGSETLMIAIVLFNKIS